eukprot:15457313-Alexandrium_andersonii.AAC.1
MLAAALPSQALVQLSAALLLRCCCCCCYCCCARAANQPVTAEMTSAMQHRLSADDRLSPAGRGRGGGRGNGIGSGCANGCGGCSSSFAC